MKFPLNRRHMNKKGDLLVGSFMLIFAIALLVVIVPVMNGFISVSKQNNENNCYGYTNSQNPSLSYNSSLPTSIGSCVALDAAVPLTVVGVILVGILGILSTRPSNPMEGY